MMVPTIHLNGTSKQSLLDDLEAVDAALEAAYQAMKRSAPNGRDYYPQGPEAYGKARVEHECRLRKIDDVKNEITELAKAIYAANT